MPTESYNLEFKYQTDKACCFIHCGETIWLPKTQIEVDGVSCEQDFETLTPGEDVDVYIPDWLAEDKGLL